MNECMSVWMSKCLKGYILKQVIFLSKENIGEFTWCLILKKQEKTKVPYVKCSNYLKNLI